MDDEKVYVIKNDKEEYHDENGGWASHQKKAQRYPDVYWSKEVVVCTYHRE